MSLTRKPAKPMSDTKKKPAQLELFAGHVSSGDVHALGLLGWRDPLWTRRFEIQLLDRSKLILTLATIRQLHAIAKMPALPLGPGGACAAENARTPS